MVVAVGLVVLMVVGWLFGDTSLLSVVTAAVMAGFIVAVVALTESQMALQAVRLRATEKIAHAHARELAVYADHCTRSINDIRRISPPAATEREAALTLDLTRLHALGVHIHRQEPRG